MASPNLNITDVAASQNQKEVTLNDAVHALDNAMNSTLSKTITTHVTLTATEVRGAILVRLTGTPAGAFDLTMPTGIKRLIAVSNETGQTATVKCSTTSITLNAANAAMFHLLGATPFIKQFGSSGGGSAASVSDEGTQVLATPTDINFAGAGVSVADDGDGTVTVTIAGGTADLSGRNILVNGNFDLWQRGTSDAAAASQRYLADRWLMGANGTTIAGSRQSFTVGQTDVPGEPAYYHRCVVVSAAGAANWAGLRQRVEGVRTLAGQTATLTFYAKADAAKNIALELIQSFGAGGTPSAAVNAIGPQLIVLTTSWQRFEITVAIPSISGKTLGSSGGDYLDLLLWFEGGSDYNARNASLGQQSGTFDIAQVQLELGSTATEFDRRPIAQEVMLCQRYFQARPATSRFVAGAGGEIGSEAISYSGIMRAAPTGTITGVGINVNQQATFPQVDNITSVGARFTIRAAAAGDCAVLGEVINFDAEL